MRFHFSRLWVGRILFGRSPLLRALFARSAKIFRRRSGRSRGVYQAGFDAVRSGRSFASLGGFGALEARAMLAADDIVKQALARAKAKLNQALFGLAQGALLEQCLFAYEVVGLVPSDGKA